jgi:folate-binding protein YgfZ
MQTSCLLHEHERRGARLAGRPEAPELGTALTYGDVPAEYEAARNGCLLLDCTDRGALGVRGPEALSFLQRILANDLGALWPGGGQRNLLLSPKGKVLFDFDLFLEEDGALLDAPPGSTQALHAALDTYLFSEKLSLDMEHERHAPLELVGPGADEILAELTGELPDRADRAWIERPWRDRVLRIARVPVAGSMGWRVDGGAEAAAPLWEGLCEAGATPGGIAVRDILRVEAGAALHGVDVDENVYPQEARLEEAFSLEKGCFVGQEVVAKIDTYGGLNKLLVGLKLGTDDPQARGTRLELRAEGETRDLGVLTSWAYSFVLDTGLALGYVKRRHQETGTVLQLAGSGVEATIVDLPLRG